MPKPHSNTPCPKCNGTGATSVSEFNIDICDLCYGHGDTMYSVPSVTLVNKLRPAIVSVWRQIGADIEDACNGDNYSAIEFIVNHLEDYSDVPAEVIDEAIDAHGYAGLVAVLSAEITLI